MFKMLKRRIIKPKKSKYNKNKYIKYIDVFNVIDYPIKMPYPSTMNYNVTDGYVYYCFEMEDIEYIMVTDENGINHSVSAYRKNGNIRERVGALFYRREPKKYNIALKSYVVHNNYARQGIGGNLLRVILRSENRLLRKGNIYVHACASGHGDKHLSQKELENHYEKYGIVLCSECYSGAYKGEKPKKYVRNNLKYQIDITMKL